MVPQRGASACVSIKGALVIGAFIIIASVFSVIAPGMGAHTTYDNSLSACPVLAARPSGLNMLGNVGMADSGTASVRTLTCTIGLDEAADPVNLDRVIVTVMAPAALETLQHSPVYTPTPGTWSAASSQQTEDGFVLSPGDSVDITLNLLHSLSPGSAVTINIRPQHSLPLSIRLRVPADTKTPYTLSDTETP
jgi:archaellin